MGGKERAGKKSGNNGREKWAGKKVAVAILAGQSGGSNFNRTKSLQKLAILDDQMSQLINVKH